METLGLIGVAAIILAAFAYALWPLSRPAVAGTGGSGEADAADAAGVEIARLLIEREQAYRNIREIDMDREMGKLSEEDYGEMIGRARSGALNALRRLEACGVKEGMVPAYLGEGEAVDAALDPKLTPFTARAGSAPSEEERIDERLEAEILRHRKVLPPKGSAGQGSAGVDEKVEGGIQPDGPGSAVEESAEVDEKAEFCPECGARAEKSHKFCPGCGSKLK